MHYFLLILLKMCKIISWTPVVPPSFNKYLFKIEAIFFKCVRVLQLIDLLQKSELKKVYKCTRGINFVKGIQIWTAESLFFAFFGFCNVFQKLLPQAQKYTFSSSDFCTRSINCKTITHLKKIAPDPKNHFIKEVGQQAFKR